MEFFLFVVPSLLVAAAYLLPVMGAEQKSAGRAVFGPMCGCKR